MHASAGGAARGVGDHTARVRGRHAAGQHRHGQHGAPGAAPVVARPQPAALAGPPRDEGDAGPPRRGERRLQQPRVRRHQRRLRRLQPRQQDRQGDVGQQAGGLGGGQGHVQAGGRRGGARVVGQQAHLPAGHHRLRRRPRQRLALPLPGAEERRRGLPHPLLHHAVHRGHPHLLPGAGHRAAPPQGRHRRVEPGVSAPGRHRHRLGRRVLQRGVVLQHHHRLVPLLLRPEFPIPTAVGRVPSKVLPEWILRSGAGMRDVHPHAVLLVPHDAHGVGGHQQPQRLQLEDRHRAGHRLDPGLHVHDQGHRLVREGGVRDGDLPLPGAYYLLLPGHHAQGLHGRAATLVHPQVAHALGPGGVAGGGHSDLLLAGAGLRRPHRLLLLQPRQQQLLARRHHGVAHQLPYVHVRRHRRLLRHRLQGHHELREVPGAAQRDGGGVERGLQRGLQRVLQLHHRHERRAAGHAGVRPAEGAGQLGRGHGPGLHHLHRGHQPVPRGAVLVRALLPDALHARHRLAVRHTGRRRHVHRGHEAVPEPAQGGSDRRAVPHLLHHLHGVRARRGQLRVRALRQLQRQLPAAHHRLLRVHRRVLRVRPQEVRRRHRADDGLAAAPVLAHLLEVPVAAGHAVHPGGVHRADRGGRLRLRGLGGREGRDGAPRVASVGAGAHRHPDPRVRALDPRGVRRQDVRPAHHRGQREGLVPGRRPARVPRHPATRGDHRRDAAVLHPRGRQRGPVLPHWRRRVQRRGGRRRLSALPA